MYDVTCRESFENVAKWITETENYANEYMVLILIGNKVDLEEELSSNFTLLNQIRWEVTYEEGIQFAEENNLLFLETSAKTGRNVKKIFKSVAENVLSMIEQGKIDPTDEVIHFNLLYC